ncbi:MAG: septal ring lytic transglycosylase RlpA family protein [Bauldia sp.]
MRIEGKAAWSGAIAVCRIATILTALCLLAGCGGLWPSASRGFRPSDYGVSASPRVVDYGEPVPRGGGRQIVGKPYMVAGRWYYPADVSRYSRVGTASWYGLDFHGRYTANGEVYDMDSLSAAHTTLPLPSYARVTNLVNGRSVVVRVNDRGPYVGDRLIDLSARAAELLDFKEAGTAQVRVDYVGMAPLDGLDGAELAATYRGPGVRYGAREAQLRTARSAESTAAPALASARPGGSDSLGSLIQPAASQPSSERTASIRR